MISHSLLILQDHRTTDCFFAVSGVQIPQHDLGLFIFHRVVFSSQLKSKVGNNLVKVAVSRIHLN